MSDFLTQAAWAKRLGVSVQTFRVWRGLGLIPAPAPLPGWPRWSGEVVAQTTAKLKAVKRGLFQRREAVGNRQQHGSDRAQFHGVSRRHRHASMKTPNAGDDTINSVDHVEAR